MAKLKEPPPGPIDEEATLMRLLKTPHKDHAPLKATKVKPNPASRTRKKPPKEG